MILATLNLKAQNENMGYRIMSSKDGIDYLMKNGMNLQDFTREFQIPSKNGSIYKLLNGEVVLILLRGKGEYPGFVFDNYESFQKCCDADFFPIAEEDMTWLELHAYQVKKFLTEDSFYIDPLKNELKIKVPFENVVDCEMGYEKLVKYLGSKKNKSTLKIEVVNCYALAFSEFLIKRNDYTWVLTKKYEIYNPYFFPLLSKGENENVDVISKLLIAVDRSKRIPFREFYWFVTKIPPYEKID